MDADLNPVATAFGLVLAGAGAARALSGVKWLFSPQRSPVSEVNRPHQLTPIAGVAAAFLAHKLLFLST